MLTMQDVVDVVCDTYLDYNVTEVEVDDLYDETRQILYKANRRLKRIKKAFDKRCKEVEKRGGYVPDSALHALDDLDVDIDLIDSVHHRVIRSIYWREQDNIVVEYAHEILRQDYVLKSDIRERDPELAERIDRLMQENEQRNGKGRYVEDPNDDGDDL